jgi:peptide-methionine (S)-S-oxide reductase
MTPNAPHALQGHEIAILGGGCFWCLEAVYQEIRGVHSVVSGYMGGHLAYPDYEQVCGKKTGHAEVVRVVFDPALLSYAKVLEIFFAIHDPTTPHRQGNDIGPQYRSIIFVMTDAQRRTAQETLASLAGFFTKPVTELIDVSSGDASLDRFVPDQAAWLEHQAFLSADIPVEHIFWPAEDEHQNYFRTHPHQGYCAFVVAPKVDKVRTKFTALIVPAANRP